jgi:alpha-L-fucosidase
VPSVIVDTAAEPMAQGKFAATWDSLRQYKTPEWFRDAKLGIWAHWGPQCEAEDGDWYGRNMYVEGSEQNTFHVAHYGPPSQLGFKDIIHQWKAERWDPDKLVALYQGAGAQYFVALANHHDNFDLWDSKYHQWNSVHIGPQKDVGFPHQYATKSNVPNVSRLWSIAMTKRDSSTNSTPRKVTTYL